MEDSGLLDGFVAFEGVMGTVVGLIAIAIASALILVLLPLLGVALELVLLVLLLSSGLLGRVVLRRPWTVEAIDLDNGERSVAFAVKGFGNAGRAVEELTEAISASGTPQHLTQGARTTLPRPTF